LISLFGIFRKHGRRRNDQKTLPCADLNPLENINN